MRYSTNGTGTARLPIWKYKLACKFRSNKFQMDWLNANEKPHKFHISTPADRVAAVYDALYFYDTIYDMHSHVQRTVHTAFLITTLTPKPGETDKGNIKKGKAPNCTESLGKNQTWKINS